MRRASLVLFLWSVVASFSCRGDAAPQTAAEVRASESTKLSQIPVPSMGTAQLTAGDVQSYIDGLIPTQLVHGDLAGAAVVVLHNGEVLLQKGYGQADVARQIPVDPAQTLFRFGSISKLMTYVSVMQLVEQGKLNLDTDVNRYLDFEIEPAFGKPITIRNLMTHTAGFEDQQQYLLDRNPPIPLRDYLVRYQPRRIYPPGYIGSYSGYGVGLLGYLVQHTSGERFEDYVDHHIFTPLGMEHSTFEQPVPERLRGSLSKGYFSTNEPAVQFEVFNTAPSGGMSSTVTDVARFAQALLDGGVWQGHRVLKEETVRQMWTRQFAMSPLLPAMCLGFYEVDSNGKRFVGHNGDTRVFHSELEIQPENHLVFLIAYNSLGADGSGGDQARPEVFDAILNRYFPYQETRTWRPVDEAARGIEGTFVRANRMESGRFKLSSLLSQIQIKIDSEGRLINRKAIDARGHLIRLRYLGNDLWEDEVGQGKMMALRDSHGKVDRLASMFGATMMVRVPWYENAHFVLPLLAFSLGATALTSCLSLVSLLQRIRLRRSGNKLERRHRTTELALTKWQTWAGLVWAPAMVIPLGALQEIAKQPLPDFPMIPAWFLVQNVMIAIAISLSAPAFLQAAGTLLKKSLSLLARLAAVVLMVSYIFLIWFSLHWHLLGSMSRY